MPKPGFHKAMRALTEEFGILLIFDEVKTGFRFAKGGAAEFFGITPDLAHVRQGDGQRLSGRGVRRPRARSWSMLPDKVSHGGTYAGNRVAAAAAVKTLEILARHRRPGDDPRDRADASRTACARSSTRSASRTTSRATRSMFGIMFREEEATRVPRLGDDRPRAVRRDRHRHARPRRDARARLPRAVVHVRGARRGRHRRPRPDRLRGLARRGARGARPRRCRADAARRHGLARRGCAGAASTMVLDGNAVRSVDRAAALLLALGESPGRGRRHRARPTARPAQVDGLAAARDAPEARASSSRTTRPASTGSGWSSSAWPRGPSGRSTCAASPCPELERLARLTHETTGLGILDGDTLLTVAQVDGPNLIAVGDWTGRSTPLHCVASGKVLLSSLAEREVLRIVRRGLVSLHRADDRRARAAARGAGPDPPARLRHGDRRVRAGPQRGRAPRSTTRAATSSPRSTSGGRPSA